MRANPAAIVPTILDIRANDSCRKTGSWTCLFLLWLNQGAFDFGPNGAKLPVGGWRGRIEVFRRGHHQPAQQEELPGGLALSDGNEVLKGHRYECFAVFELDGQVIVSDWTDP